MLCAVAASDHNLARSRIGKYYGTNFAKEQLIQIRCSILPPLMRFLIVISYSM